MLAQLRVPSGFELGFCCSGAGAVAAGTASADTCSQDESRFVLSVCAESQPAAAVSGVPVGSAVGPSAAGASSGLTTWLPRVPFAKPALPPRAFPRPRSVPRPRPPRDPSNPPLPRTPRVDEFVASASALGVSLALDWDLSFVFFFTSPHWEMLPN